MKLINVECKTWETLAAAQSTKEEPFELLGFDLENPRHRTFWEQMKMSGKFHSSVIPKVKATFVPAS